MSGRGGGRDRRGGGKAPRGTPKGSASGGAPGDRERERRRPSGSAPGRPADRSAARGPDGPRGGAVLYGRNAVREALQARRRPVHRVWATPPAAREPWLKGVRVELAEVEEIERRCGSDGHQGICAEAGPYPYADAGGLLAGPAPLLVVLDEVTDVQNLGAICRTAECAGATGVVIPERRSAEVTPAACKASAGAVEHLPVARVRNLADFLAEAKDAGLWVYGAAMEGAVGHREVDWRGGVAIVLGAEGKGLRPRVAATCDALVALPMRGRIASLNVSAAAAVLLYTAAESR